MSKIQDGRVTESATEARQAEPGPSILVLLIVSLVLALGLMVVVWFVFFKS
jgi:flagellar basal body-associated protein FliL